MRLETRVLIDSKRPHWRKMEITLTKETVIVEAEDPDHCIVILNGQQYTIDYPYITVSNIIKEL